MLFFTRMCIPQRGASIFCECSSVLCSFCSRCKAAEPGQLPSHPPVLLYANNFLGHLSLKKKEKKVIYYSYLPQSLTAPGPLFSPMSMSAPHWIFPSSRWARLRLTQALVYVHAQLHGECREKKPRQPRQCWWVRAWGKLVKEQPGLHTKLPRQLVGEICL